MFNRKVGIFLIAVFSVLLLTGKAHASTQDFTISSFTADYYLDRNDTKTSTLKVDEEIVADFPNYDQNHGILRAIPEKYQGHTVSLAIDKVTDETGKSYAYTSSTVNDNTVLKIGDANNYVHGQKTYKISYSLRNVINFQASDELYWDINGDQWQQPMSNVTGRLHIPSSLTSELTGDQICYTGTNGSKEQNCTITKDEVTNGSVITTQAVALRPGENATFDVGFKKGTFQQGPEIAQEKRNEVIGLIVLGAVMLLLPLITFIVCFQKWRTSGRDPKGRGVIIPEYVSPKNLNVLGSSFILNQTFEPKAASAGIIELAVLGYLRLSEIKKKKLLGTSTDYQIEITKDVSSLPKEQQLILDALFDGGLAPGASTTVSSQKNKLYTTIKKINDHLATSLTTLGYFSSDPSKAKKRFTGVAVGFLVAGFFLMFTVALGVGFILSAIILFIFGAIMPARSPRGVETHEYLLGLKEYIKMAEADRIKYLQSPQGAEKKQIDPNNPKQQIKLFEDLLPYAMLFGLEKEWAKQFNDLYTQPPSWYSGNMSTFNAIYLANSLSGFSTANSASFSAPSSSGSSGFGGGGFSGGGGGGGGGGGW